MSDDALGSLWSWLKCNPWGYARDGRPLADIIEWGNLHADLAYVHVRCTLVRDAEVSTVWVGLAQAGSTPDKPLIFETMIYGGDFDGYQFRYATESEADAGHDRVVDLLRVKAATT